MCSKDNEAYTLESLRPELCQCLFLINACCNVLVGEMAETKAILMYSETCLDRALP